MSETVDSSPRYKKLTINLSPELHNELQAMADERGVTITDLIRRAIALDKFVWSSLKDDDAQLLVKRGNDVRQVVLIG